MKLQGLLTIRAPLFLFSLVALFVACSGPHMPLDRSKNTMSGGGTSSGKNSVAEITFENGIVQIFEQKCSLCHAPGGALPDWTDYATTFGKQDRIRERVLVKADMPPKSMAPLLEEEKAMIGKWLGLGAPQGEVLPETSTELPESAQPAPARESALDPVTPQKEAPVVLIDVQALTPAVSPDDKITYENTIKAWFKKNCALCHDGSTPALALPNWQDFDTVLEKKDALYRRVITDAGTSTEMPPGGFNSQGEKLSESERLIFKNWIEYGAPEK